MTKHVPIFILLTILAAPPLTGLAHAESIEDQLIKQLGSTDEEVARKAEYKIKEYADDMAPALGKAWNHKNPRIRTNVRRILLGLSDSLNKAAADAVKRVAPDELDKWSTKRFQQAFDYSFWSHAETDKAGNIIKLAKAGFTFDDEKEKLAAPFLRKHLKHLVHLKSMDLSWLKLKEDDMAVLSTFKDLETLDLSYTEATGVTIQRISKLPKLKKLELYQSDVKGSGLKHLRNNNTIEHLSVGTTSALMTDEGLEHVSTFKNLNHLSVTGHLITDAGIKHLGKLKKLTYLHIHGVRTTSKGVAHLETLVNLEELSLIQTKIGDAALPHFSKMTKLKKLDLYESKVTEQGLIFLAPLKKLKNLVLTETEVLDSGMRDLATLPSLQRLSLARTKITDAGLMALAESKTLKHVDVSETKVTKAGVKAFKQKKPSCKLSSDFD